MKKFFYCRDGASKGAALMIVLAFVVLLAGVALAYFSRTTTDRQLAQSSYNDTSADLLARTALDIVVGNFKQELLNAGAVTRSNIQPQRSGNDPTVPNLIRRSVRNDPIPTPGVRSLAAEISSAPSPSASPRRGEITLARWNSHYLIPRANTGNAIDSTPVSTFTAPDWVLVTPQGPSITPTPSNVIGRYAFAVYDEGGLLDMSLAGAPIDHPSDSSNRSWPSLPCPSPTPWLLNVGRKGILSFADLTALPAAPTTFFPQSQIDNIVGWRNYAMTQRSSADFGNFNPTYTGDTGTTGCANQDSYGSYLLYFGDPPFIIESPADWLAASTYPFTAVPTYINAGRTDQAFMTRQQLLKLRSSLNFSQNVLQYMGTFSRERNWPAPDWPHLSDPGETTVLSEGRFNLNNLGLVLPNPCNPAVEVCTVAHGKKKGWQTGKTQGIRIRIRIVLFASERGADRRISFRSCIMR